jgi:plastocyanin
MSRVAQITTGYLRIIPRDSDFLNRKLGSRGEIFYDQNSDTLRIFSGEETGGFPLARADLTNINNLVFKNKATAAGITANTSVDDDAPTSPAVGELWFDTNTGTLYIYYNDGNSAQWVQPSTTVIGSGTGGGEGASNISDLLDVSLTSLVSGQILKWNGTAWTNQADLTGTSGGGGNSFTTISTAGQTSIVADSSTDNLNITAGAGITLTTNPGTKTLTISNTANKFLTFSVNGQNPVVADTSADTITLVAGLGIQISTNDIDDSITITNTRAAPITEFSNLTDSSTASLTIDRIYLPAITMLSVTNNGASAYRFDQYGTADNPTIYAISGTTIAFNLNATGHPFRVQNGVGIDYSVGLVHVSTSGIVSTGSSAQGKDSGTLYWKIPDTVSGGYRYQCGAHAAMVGSITVKAFATI